MFQPPTARCHRHHALDRSSVWKGRDEPGAWSGITIKGDEEIAVDGQRDHGTVKRQRLGPAGSLSDHHAALLGNTAQNEIMTQRL